MSYHFLIAGLLTVPLLVGCSRSNETSASEAEATQAPQDTDYDGFNEGHPDPIPLPDNPAVPLEASSASVSSAEVEETTPQAPAP